MRPTLILILYLLGGAPATIHYQDWHRQCRDPSYSKLLVAHVVWPVALLTIRLQPTLYCLSKGDNR